MTYIYIFKEGNYLNLLTVNIKAKAKNDCCVPQRSVVKSCNYRLSKICANWFKRPCCRIKENKSRKFNTTAQAY